ncbi:MAG: CocE/NonD family hydrolase [Actinomycetota bacterium]
MRVPAFLCLAALAAPTLVPGISSAQVATPEECGGPGGGESHVTEAGPHAIGRSDVVELESKVDGAVVQIGFVRPDVPASVETPVIVDAGPYFWSDLKDTDLTTCNSFLVENYVPHGYTVAFVPTRGAGDSDSCADLMGPKERSDLDQAIAWLGEQPWSGGSVGMTGISYDGSTPWEVAASGNPYLKTIVPAEGVIDLYSLIYRSGRADSRWWLFVPGYQWDYNTVTANPTNGRDPTHWANAAVCEDVVAGLAATAETYATGEDDSFGYWTERNSRPGTEKRYEGSIFVVQGLQDWNVVPSQVLPWVNKLERKGAHVKMMLGQWQHSWPDTAGNGEGTLRWDYADILLRWWDRWLKRRPRGPLGPRVEVQDSDGRWRTSASWPPANAAETKLFLEPTALRGTASGAEERTTLAPSARSRYIYINDSTNQSETPLESTCTTCAVFATARQENDLHVSGIPTLDLTVVPHGSGGNVSAYLYRAEGESGYRLIGWGSADVRFPDGGHEAAPVTPGEEMELAFDMEPLDAVVHEGERLVLVLDQGNTNDMPGPPAFPVDLAYGGAKSSFTFPVVSPEQESYFTPPPNPDP